MRHLGAFDATRCGISRSALSDRAKFRYSFKLNVVSRNSIRIPFKTGGEHCHRPATQRMVESCMTQLIDVSSTGALRLLSDTMN
jgi:hypothetical protein